MAPKQLATLEQRVAVAAEAALEDKGYVTAIDVLAGLGWLPQDHVEAWRQSRLLYLEAGIEADPVKVSTAMKSLRRWARQRGLQSVETDYVAGSGDRHPLRFSQSGRADVERAYRTHWMSPDLSKRKRERLVEQLSRPPELVVVSPLKAWTCHACGRTGGLLVMEAPGPVCLVCADLDHLAFVPSGNAALTRRAKKAGTLSAVVLRFSRARKRYERQGILVEETARAQAEEQCLADEEARLRRRQRDEGRRAAEDRRVQARVTEEIARRFPACPPERVEAIARHATTRASGRVGRTAAARDLDPTGIELAVTASVRHHDTRYDELLMAGVERIDARVQVQADVREVLARWRRPATP